MTSVQWACGVELLQPVQVCIHTKLKICFIFCPTAQKVYLSHGNTPYYANNTAIIISSIMTTDDASLTCHTDSATCCRGVDNGDSSSNMGTGEWLLPNGESTARNRVTGDGFYWIRGTQSVQLYRQGDIQTPLGHHCCTIPDSGGEMRTFCANLVGELNMAFIIYLLVTFSAIRCDPLMTAPDNGRVIYSNQIQNGKFIFGTVATYTCSPSYGLSSTMSQTCITDNGGGTIGIFNGSEPTCDGELIDCYN